MFATDYFAADYFAPDYFPPGGIIEEILSGGGKYTGKVEVYDLDVLLRKIKDDDIRKETKRLLAAKSSQYKAEKVHKGTVIDYTLPIPITYVPLDKAKPLQDIENVVDREIAKLLRIREIEIFALIQQIHAEEVLKQEEEVFLLLMLL